VAGSLKKLGVGGQASSGGCVAEQLAHFPNRHSHRNRQSRRPVSPDRWAAISAAVIKQHLKLAPDSPRRRPTLPRLAFLRDLDGGVP
jgi:hypothetical protein